jgi:hypothetical protein
MQLGHPRRQLLSRSLRWYSARTAPENSRSDAIASSGAPVSPRLKRPSASTFEGINIRTPCLPQFQWFLIPISPLLLENVVIPTKSASQSFHKRTNRPCTRVLMNAFPLFTHKQNFYFYDSTVQRPQRSISRWTSPGSTRTQ